LQFLIEKFFSPKSFQFSPELLNKLAPDRYWDFEGSIFLSSRIDYPIHGIIELIQAMTLFRLYDPLVLARIQDNEIRFPKGQQPFTMAELFLAVQDAVWQELNRRENINSFRRELQRIHLYALDEIVLRSPFGFPRDALILARADLVKIKAEIDQCLGAAQLDAYTKAHLEESAAKIEAVLSAQVERRF
ncbi:MAG: zinc-dependent metalloprotease, partial [Marinirhabdus sp.]|nr:zinc-dependent metalloprotease [Marinirhabdus sp.]